MSFPPLQLNLAGQSSASSGLGGINLSPSVLTGGKVPPVNNTTFYLILGTVIVGALIWARK